LAWYLSQSVYAIQDDAPNNRRLYRTDVSLCASGYNAYGEAYAANGDVSIDGQDLPAWTGPLAVELNNACTLIARRDAWVYGDDNGWHDTVGASSWFNGGGGYAPGYISTSATTGGFQYDRKAKQITTGPSVSRSSNGQTLYYSSTDPGANNGGPARDYDWNYYYPGIGWTDLANTDEPNGSFGVDAHKTYYVRVLAYNTAGDNGWSPSSVASYGIPNKPTGLVATKSTTIAGRIGLYWSAPSYVGAGIQRYHIYRDNVFWTSWESGTPPTSTNQLYDDNKTRGTTYTYTVYANNSTGWSPISDPASAVAPGVPNAPGVPTVYSKIGRNVTIAADKTSVGYGNDINSSTGWRLQLSTDNGVTWKGWNNTTKAFVTNGYNFLDSNGKCEFNLLTPALTYKWRAYAINSIVDNGATPEYATMADGIFVSSGGKRWNGSQWKPTEIAKRWNGSGWTDITIAKRWNGSAWVDLT